MDWKVVGQLLASTAPFAGKVLGGFIPIPGAAFAVELLGKGIAKQFGIPEAQATPANVAAAIANNPNEVVLAKINAALEALKSENQAWADVETAWAAAVVHTTESTNTTMRLELLPENRHAYYTGWRAACGWALFAFIIAFGSVLMYGLAFDDAVVDRIIKAMYIIFAFFGLMLAVVGVAWVMPRQQPKHQDIERIAATPAKPIAKK